MELKIAERILGRITSFTCATITLNHNLAGDTGFEPVNDDFKDHCLRPDLANPLYSKTHYTLCFGHISVVWYPFMNVF